MGAARRKVWDCDEPDGPCPGGFNAYDIRYSYKPGWLMARVTKTGERFLIASTQAHFMLQDPRLAPDRDILREICRRIRIRGERESRSKSMN
jgi:hypothetical protein